MKEYIIAARRIRSKHLSLHFHGRKSKTARLRNLRDIRGKISYAAGLNLWMSNGRWQYGIQPRIKSDWIATFAEERSAVLLCFSPLNRESMCIYRYISRLYLSAYIELPMATEKDNGMEKESSGENDEDNRGDRSEVSFNWRAFVRGKRRRLRIPRLPLKQPITRSKWRLLFGISKGVLDLSNLALISFARRIRRSVFQRNYFECILREQFYVYRLVSSLVS